MPIPAVGTVVKPRRFLLCLVLCLVVTGGVAGLSAPADGIPLDDGNSNASVGTSASHPTDVTPAYGSSEKRADHDETVGDRELVEVQTFTTEATEDGRVRVELGYHIGSAISRLQITVRESMELVESDGFSPVEDQQNTFAWDQETTQPSITVEKNANETRKVFEGLDFVRTDQWTLTNTVRTYVQWWAINPESIERSTVIQSGEQGFTGSEMVYLGGYERHEFGSSTETFDIVVADRTSNVSVDEIGTALERSSEMLDVGARNDEVRVFVVSDPLRRGGLALGADFWVHEGGLGSTQTTLWHEYVHTRQEYEYSDPVQWTIEGSADYFAYLLALRQGQIQYHDFHASMSTANERFSDVVLAEPGTWRGTLGNYRLGSLVLAALDGEIRASSGGSATLEDVFGQLNSHGQAVSSDAFEEIVRDVAGESLEDVFETHVQSSPGNLTVPPPSRYEVPESETNLEVEATDAKLEPGERGSIQFHIRNTGNETSLAPYLDVNVPTELTGGLPAVNTTAGVDSRITAVDGGWAFDHLEPGETLVIEYEVLVPEIAPVEAYTVDSTVTDLGGNQARKSTAVEVTSVPSAALVADSTVPVGEELLLDASGSTDRVSIESYRWEIVGPDGALTETADPELESAFAEPGEYTVTLTVVNELGRTDTVDRRFLVNDRPEVSVDAPATTTAGESVRVSVEIANEFGETEVVWSADNRSANGDTVEFTFAEPGSQEVSVTVGDEYGQSVTETVTISVSEPTGGDETTTASENGDSDDGSDTVVNGNESPGEDGAGFGIAVALAGCVLALLVAGRAAD